MASSAAPAVPSRPIFLARRRRSLSLFSTSGHAPSRGAFTGVDGGGGESTEGNAVSCLDRLADRTPDVFNLFPEYIASTDSRSFKMGLFKSLVFILLNIGVLSYFATVASQSTMQTIKVTDTSFANIQRISSFNPRCTCGMKHAHGLPQMRTCVCVCMYVYVFVSEYVSLCVCLCLFRDIL